MHYFKTLPTIAALSTIIAASVASPALAKREHITQKFTLASKGPTADTASWEFIGVLEMCTGDQCNGPSTETISIYGGPGSAGCLPVPTGWVTESVSFSQGIGNVPGCYATTWSSSNCGGPSTVVPVQECLAIPYAAVSIDCPW